MITSHVFRIHGMICGGDGSQGGVAQGMCTWLGTCNRPEAEHARKRRPQRPKAGRPT